MKNITSFILHQMGNWMTMKANTHLKLLGNERAKALDIFNEELKVFKPSDGELFSEMTNLLMIENIRHLCVLIALSEKSVFRENALLSTYIDDVTARGVAFISQPEHQLCQNPNSNPDITSILMDHSCGPQNAAQGQVHVANEFSSIRRSGANNVNEVDGSVSLMNVEAQAEQMALVASTSGSKRREHTESLSLTMVPKKPRTPRIRDSRVLEYSRPLNPAFKDVKTFIDFKIIYGGLCIDNELSEDLRSSYYRLCFQKKQCLHDGALTCMIGETFSIAAKIKNTKLTTAKEELETWDSILKAFELLVMKVRFLRDRKHLLATFLFESEAEPDWNVLKARYQKWKKNNFTLKFIIKG
ncbi:B3 DNA binding domain-containing protein [Artemisia annua]|uniref:B3 DNA binding domain-containing protein n=1 Tax=Artemisia annua TaxID=35608 RepID=A0A2U1LF97_ARTAN|nr:B3 DNA binding domain-containing protein [Artemisia annua]